MIHISILSSIFLLTGGIIHLFIQWIDKQIGLLKYWQSKSIDMNLHGIQKIALLYSVKKASAIVSGVSYSVGGALFLLAIYDSHLTVRSDDVFLCLTIIAGFFVVMFSNLLREKFPVAWALAVSIALFVLFAGLTLSSLLGL